MLKKWQKHDTGLFIRSKRRHNCWKVWSFGEFRRSVRLVYTFCTGGYLLRPERIASNSSCNQIMSPCTVIICWLAYWDQVHNVYQVSDYVIRQIYWILVGYVRVTYIIWRRLRHSSMVIYRISTEDVVFLCKKTPHGLHTRDVGCVSCNS